jgi:macrodomain Ter protein organizer (MatP/YcbG family)
MADKEYLDREGLKKVKRYIDDHLIALKEAIDLLQDTDETPESIKEMIDNAIEELHIEDLEQEDSLIIYGGNASEEGNG